MLQKYVWSDANQMEIMWLRSKGVRLGIVFWYFVVIILIENLCISDDFVSNNLVLLEIELLVSWGKYVYILIHLGVFNFPIFEFDHGFTLFDW